MAAPCLDPGTQGGPVLQAAFIIYRVDRAVRDARRQVSEGESFSHILSRADVDRLIAEEVAAVRTLGVPSDFRARVKARVAAGTR